MPAGNERNVKVIQSQRLVSKRTQEKEKTELSAKQKKEK
jgi:hypothetical protein